MVIVDTYITGDPPTRVYNVKYECDLCGRRCDQMGDRTGRLWWYKEERLCAECIMEELDNDGTIQQVE